MDLVLNDVLITMFIVAVFIAIYFKTKCERLERKAFCSCEGCQNNESGWLSKEYRKKYPHCKMR